MQESGTSRQAARALLLANAGALTLAIAVFGDMVRDACYMNRAASLYCFFASLVVTILALQFKAWGRPEIAETRHTHLCRQGSGVLLLVALVLFTVGGLDFIYHIAHNEIVACDSGDQGDNLQTYGT